MKSNNPLTDGHVRLYRDLENKKIGGVCAGLADYFSIDVTIVRIATVLAGITFTFVTVAVYIFGVIFLPPKPVDLYSDPNDENYWRRYRRSPRNTLSEARNKFMRLETRLRKLEGYVTSKKFNLDQQFEDMDRQSR